MMSAKSLCWVSGLAGLGIALAGCKGDQGATGKGALVGAGCKYCLDSAWEVKSAHLP